VVARLAAERRTLDSMKFENVLAVIALTWLVASVLLMARSIRRGRELAEALAARHPATYEALGRPRPGYFESVRRTRFAQFVGRREFASLTDGSLSAEFEAYRRSESRLVLCILVSGAIVASLVLVARHAA
jgi:hypothetical protein